MGGVTEKVYIQTEEGEHEKNCDRIDAAQDHARDGPQP